ncbi:hypothetical protein [Wolbachia endosymbiont of Kerria lacca]
MYQGICSGECSSQCSLSCHSSTGMALLHHSRKEQAVTDGICYKIDI